MVLGSLLESNAQESSDAKAQATAEAQAAVEEQSPGMEQVAQFPQFNPQMDMLPIPEGAENADWMLGQILGQILPPRPVFDCRNRFPGK